MEWIPATQLPPSSGWYLVWIDGRVMFGCWHPEDDSFEAHWSDYEGAAVYPMGEPTHWMPLPTAPQII